MTQTTEFDFTEVLLELHALIKKEVNHNASLLLQMATNLGGYDTVKSIVCATAPSSCFVRLKRVRRLDLTVEAWILRPEWHEQFSPALKLKAFSRLFKEGFRVPDSFWQPAQDYRSTAF